MMLRGPPTTILPGLLFESETNPAVDFALKIQSLIYGGLLGVFLIGIVYKKANMRDAVIAYTSAILVLALLFILPKYNIMPALNLTWFTFFGVVISFIVVNICFVFKIAKNIEN